MSETVTPASFFVSEVVQIAPSRQLAVVVAVSPAGGVSVKRHPSGHVTPFAPGALDSRHKRDARCSCRGFDDGSVYRSLCPVHADSDPCLTMSQVTGRRRKGTIRRGVCTACGHDSRRPA